MGDSQNDPLRLWIDQAHRHRKHTNLILDMDSSVSETYGHQQGRFSIR